MGGVGGGRSFQDVKYSDLAEGLSVGSKLLHQLWKEDSRQVVRQEEGKQLWQTGRPEQKEHVVKSPFFFDIQADGCWLECFCLLILIWLYIFLIQVSAKGSCCYWSVLTEGSDYKRALLAEGSDYQRALLTEGSDYQRALLAEGSDYQWFVLS